MVKKDQRVDSIESFLQQNALSPNNHLDNFVQPGDTTETDTASISSSLPTNASSVQGLQMNFSANTAGKTRKGTRGYVRVGVPDGLSTKSPKQGMGRGKWRRYQNNLGLLTGIEEEETLEENIAAEIAEENTTVFSELFEDPSKMTVWQSFIRMPETEQRRFLLSVAEDFEQAACPNDNDVPSMSAEECFKRIDQKLRRIVAHRSPPVDIIEPMEDELTGFFTEMPEGILDVEKPDIYHRMIFHAICQYFGLLSKSVKQRDTCRTKVRNRWKKGTFYQPDKRLSVYLCEKYFVY